jgi:hypothetical protein
MDLHHDVLSPSDWQYCLNATDKDFSFTDYANEHLNNYIYTMKESVAVAKEADRKKGFSPRKSNNKIIHRVQHEPERQLGSLWGMIDNIRRDGGTPSVESIATELSSMPSTAQRASVLIALQRTHGNQYVQRVVEGIQAKLKVGQSGDVYEHEADRVADAVMRMPGPRVQIQLEEEEFLRTKKREDTTPEVTHDHESRIHTLQGGGYPLAEHVRTFFEPRFGYDFSQVRIHTDGGSAETVRAVNARAFTIGRDVVFGAGQYTPGTSNGQRLLAHELTHVVQQRQFGGIALISRKDAKTEKTEAEKKKEAEQLKVKLDRIERTYQRMIKNARKKGYKVAADNLERFLKGIGGVKKIPVNWLRGFSAVTDADRVNQKRFEKSLTEKAYKLKDEKSEAFHDYGDRKLTASSFTELYYASGTSTLRSTGTFKLTRKGKVITIKGSVDHHWWDKYDWHAGLAAYIPGYGTISDSDALLLQKHRGAAPFDMEAYWKQSVIGTVEIIEWWFDKINYAWQGL